MENIEYYVVTRDGRRVSRNNHLSKELAMAEAKRWTALIHKVVNGRKWDPKSVISIVKTNKPNRIK